MIWRLLAVAWRVEDLAGEQGDRSPAAFRFWLQEFPWLTMAMDLKRTWSLKRGKAREFWGEKGGEPLIKKRFSSFKFPENLGKDRLNVGMGFYRLQTGLGPGLPA